MSSRQTMLVVRDSGLGDLVTAVPALRGLRRAYPYHEIVTTCPASLCPLAKWLRVADAYQTEGLPASPRDPSAHPEIDRLILGGSWRDEIKSDVLVWLRVPEDPEPLEKLMAARPRSVVMYALPGLVGSERCPDFTFSDHILRRWERLLAAFDISTNGQDLYLDRYLEDQRRRGRGLPPIEHGLTVIHPGAASTARQWPPERWAVVASLLRDAGHRIALTGSRAEGGIAAQIVEAARLSHDCDLTGRTDVMSLAAVIAGARLVLSTDTGPAHLAIAFRRPSLTLFGPVAPDCWGPPTDALSNVCIWRGIESDPYARTVAPGLLGISAEDVMKAVSEM